MNLLLKNCKIVVNGKEFLKHLAIVDGKIEKICSTDVRVIPDAKTKVIDVEEKYVIPGVIDPHVHFREPGFEHKEDLFTGSKAAAKGGITTFIDMPNTKPPTFTIEEMDKKRELAKKSIVNFGFHMGASAQDNNEEIIKAKNVASTKIYMNQTTGNLLVIEDELLKSYFRNSKIVAVHAEEEMCEKAIRFTKDYGKALYICHVSLASEIESVRKAKEAGINIYAEATPHHLSFTKDDVKDSFLMMKPELKTKEDQQELWGAVLDGTIDTIGTDHAPHTFEEKKQGENGPYGVPGVETSLPLMLDAVNAGKITMQRLIELMCNKPAEIFNIKNKGFLKEGLDADITIVDMDLEKEVRDEDIISKCRWTPYAGMKLKGWPIMTIVGGNIVFENNNISLDNYGKKVEF
jgi:dihydroorotase